MSRIREKRESGDPEQVQKIGAINDINNPVPENRISGSLCGRNKSTMVVLKAAISKNTFKGVKFVKS